MTTVKGDKSHECLKHDLLKVLDKHSAHLSAEEILAVISQMVGMAVALQDQRIMRPEQAMEIVSKNIEQGNQLVIDDLLASTGGNA